MWAHSSFLHPYLTNLSGKIWCSNAPIARFWDLRHSMMKMDSCLSILPSITRVRGESHLFILSPFMSALSENPFCQHGRSPLFSSIPLTLASGIFSLGQTPVCCNMHSTNWGIVYLIISFSALDIWLKTEKLGNRCNPDSSCPKWIIRWVSKARNAYCSLKYILHITELQILNDT